MSDQITPPAETDQAGRQDDLDRITSEAGPGDVVFRGVGMYRPWDLGPGRKPGSRGGFQHANH